MEDRYEHMEDLLSMVLSRFSILINYDFEIKIVSKSDFYMAVRKKKRGYYNLYIDNSIAKLQDEVIIGLMAHELSHVVYDVKLSFFEKIINIISSVNEEREADLMAINHGFGLELLAFHKWHNSKFKKYKKHEGLTTKEIKRAIKLLKS